MQTKLTTLTNNLPAAIIGDHKHLVFDLDIIAKAAPMQYVSLMHHYYACIGLDDVEAPEEDYVMANAIMIDLEERVQNGDI